MLKRGFSFLHQGIIAGVERRELRGNSTDVKPPPSEFNPALTLIREDQRVQVRAALLGAAGVGFPAPFAHPSVDGRAAFSGVEWFQPVFVFLVWIVGATA